MERNVKRKDHQGMGEDEQNDDMQTDSAKTLLPFQSELEYRHSMQMRVRVRYIAVGAVGPVKTCFAHTHAYRHLTAWLFNSRIIWVKNNVRELFSPLSTTTNSREFCGERQLVAIDLSKDKKKTYGATKITCSCWCGVAPFLLY